MSAVSTTGLVMSLLGLTSLAGAGIAVGSGISMVSDGTADAKLCLHSETAFGICCYWSNPLRNLGLNCHIFNYQTQHDQICIPNFNCLPFLNRQIS